MFVVDENSCVVGDVLIAPVVANGSVVVVVFKICCCTLCAVLALSALHGLAWWWIWGGCNWRRLEDGLVVLVALLFAVLFDTESMSDAVVSVVAEDKAHNIVWMS